MSNKISSKIMASVAVVLPVLAVSSLAAAENPGGWEYSIAPLYVWAKSADGTSGIGQAESELDLDFKDDVLENLEMGAAVHIEAKQGPLVFFGEYNYAKLEPSSRIEAGPIVLKGDVDFTDIMWEFGFRYEVANTGATQWEFLGGVRGFDQDLGITIKRVDSGEDVGILPRKVSGGDDWWHGFAGGRVTTKLSESWSFVARGDFGYRESSNKSYMLSALFDYRFNDWGSFFVGYRHLDVDYANDKNGQSYYFTDTASGGPILGVNFYF